MEERYAKISVIVPIYNVEKYLRKCLDSLVSQTYSDLEIILVNDCSTDSSLEICQEYQQKCSKIKLFSNDKNRGLSYSRNKGVKGKQGKKSGGSKTGTSTKTSKSRGKKESGSKETGKT